jgi:hypothetical protein
MADDPISTQEMIDGANEALLWLRATLRQIERFVTAVRNPFTPEFVRQASHLARQDRVDEIRSLIGSTLPFDDMPLVADAQFLLNACGQAEKCLASIGFVMADGETIRALRNVHEHWDEQKPSFASPELPKVKSGQRLASNDPEVRPWEYRDDGAGTLIGPLDLRALWEELWVIASRLRGVIGDPDPSATVPPFPGDGVERRVFSVFARQTLMLRPPQ